VQQAGTVQQGCAALVQQAAACGVQHAAGAGAAAGQQGVAGVGFIEGLLGVGCCRRQRSPPCRATRRKVTKASLDDTQRTRMLEAAVPPPEEPTMPAIRRRVSHRIELPLPVAQCQRLFTPAGEELWIEGWSPRYVHPADGRTEAGMVFTTGSAEQFTLWTMVDFETGPRHVARYNRVMPALRSDLVEVRCDAIDADRTAVTVGYTLTALTPAGERSLDDFAPAAFAARIEGWRTAIEAQLPQLRSATIR
jgi:hypothetical protein